MCGFIGISKRVGAAVLEKLSATIIHRGPDESGYYLSDHMTLIHRRLAIIDLQTGKQPICNEDERFWIVFNGEFYNYKEERKILEEKGHYFKTQSDTEVLLHLYEEYGAQAFLRINGQFALAIWDQHEQKIILARDRFGIKPLYFYLKGDLLVFASEIKAILEYTEVAKELNPKALHDYFTLRYNSKEESFFKGVYKFPPGCYGIYKERSWQVKQYYLLEFEPKVKGKSSSLEIEHSLSYLLRESVRKRLVADVEVGLFLSSGIDSGSILALASEFRPKIKAFTVGFGLALDETDKAHSLAEMYGADFHHLNIDYESEKFLSGIVGKFDEPLGDSIIIPTYLLAQAAAKEVKVVLTGEGADEVLGSYVHQLFFFYLEKYVKHLPASFLTFLSYLIRKAPLAILNMLFPYPDKLNTGEKSKISDFLKDAGNFYQTRKNMISLFTTPDFMTKAYQPAFIEHKKDDFKGNFFFKELDLSRQTWLKDYTLCKQDTLTMANSIEGRVPFLDHSIVEFLSQLPMNSFIRWANTKLPLKAAMKNKLPRGLINSKKKAFYFPYQRIFKETFVKDCLALHLDSQSSTSLKELLNFEFFGKIIEEYEKKPGLLVAKRLMAYVIFLLWYKRYFKNN